MDKLTQMTTINACAEICKDLAIKFRNAADAMDKTSLDSLLESAKAVGAIECALALSKKAELQ